jgi:hypothetical protein
VGPDDIQVLPTHIGFNGQNLNKPRGSVQQEQVIASNQAGPYGSPEEFDTIGEPITAENQAAAVPLI